jgi:putative ABC transport system ATP-binding protein
MENMIELKHLRKVYRMGAERIVALDDISLSVEKGEFCCLLGTSGSGKSTLLNMMAGLERPTRGEVIVRRHHVEKMRENELALWRQKYIGFVFQSYNLLPSLTALENVCMPMTFKRVPPKKRAALARDMLSLVGLSERVGHRPGEMSGGQQQRVSIARAFVSGPELIFADEPTGNLDTKTTTEIMTLILGMVRKNNQTLVMVTHNPELARLADKVVHIRDGRAENIEIRARDAERE